VGRGPGVGRERRRSEGGGGKLADALTWHLAWAESLEWLLQLAEENAAEGRPPPAALLRKPELEGLAERAYAAFWDLIGDRQLGFGSIGRISFLAVDRWFERSGLHPDLFDRFKRLVQVLDRIWVEKSRTTPPAPPAGATDKG
jgi:hypothetical protein